MHCVACAARVEASLRGVPGVEDAVVALASERAVVRFDPSLAGAAALQAAVAAAGYRATLALEDAASVEAERAERERARYALVSIALALPLLVEMAAHLSGMSHGLLPGWVQLALATPIQGWAGAPFYRGAIRAARARSFGMDQLVALGTSAAFGLSVWHLPQGGPFYFESAALVIALVHGGRWIEGRAKRAAGEAVRALAGLRPDTARVVRADGTVREIPAGMLDPGARVRIGPGEGVAVDGIVREGTSELDESLVTGESRPVGKVPGDQVIAGSVNGSGSLVVEVVQAGGGTLIARMLRQVAEAEAARLSLGGLVGRIAGLFVPVVLVLAAATLLGWLVAGGGADRAVIAAVSVLVVACPCAIGLATPAALAAGLGAAARRGVLVREPAAFEAADRFDTILFDKTGTLTEGTPRLVGRWGDPSTLGVAAALETGTAHPLARGVARAAVEAGIVPDAAEAVTAVPGLGVEGRVLGRAWALGSRAMLARHGIEAGDLAGLPGEGDPLEAESRGASLLFLADVEARALAGVLALADSPRQGARETVRRARDEGLDPWLVTGDAEGPARATAEALGPLTLRFGVKPEGKLALVRELQAAGRRVVMVGDGANDAAALAAADLGVAIGGGSDAALASGHAALLRPEPMLALEAVRIARATRAVVRQNLALAFLYNVAALPLAMAGQLSPAVAGGAMALSSLSVLGNALRLRKFG